VLGPGGVGGFLAAALARAGEDVVVVAREPTAELIEREGIRLQSVTLGEFVAHPEAVPRLISPAEVLFVATKATALDQALGRVGSEPDLVVPLLNGLDHLDLLRGRFGPDRVAAGVIRIETDRPEPGVVVHSSPSVRIDVAAQRPALAARLPDLVETLVAAGVPAQVGPGERLVMWSKLARLNSLSSTTSVSDRQLGFIRTDPEWSRILAACVRETVSVARADGAGLDPAATLAELESAHPELGSSMQRDLRAGREPELDAIQGSVLRAGARHGIETPTVRRLAAQIAGRAGIAPPQV
jgi:2-dehydropantoate 2-reductase